MTALTRGRALPGLADIAAIKDIDRRRGEAITNHAVVIASGETNYPALQPRMRRLTSAVDHIEADSSTDGLGTAPAGARFYQEPAR